MLERFAFTATPHQFAQRRQLRFRQLSLELEIKLHPRPTEHMPDQMLRVQPRIVDLVLLEILGARLQHLEKRHPLLRCHVDRSDKNRLGGE